MKERSRSARSTRVGEFGARALGLGLLRVCSTSRLALAPASCASADCERRLGAAHRRGRARCRRSPVRAAAASRNWSAASFCARSNSSAARCSSAAALSASACARGRPAPRPARPSARLRLDLPADARDRRVLRRDLVLGGVDGELIVAVVDPRQHVAGVDLLVVARRRPRRCSRRSSARRSPCRRRHRRRRSRPGTVPR